LHELTISQHSLLHASFIIYRQREIKERFAYIPGAEETSHHSNIYFAILVAAEGRGTWGGELKTANSQKRCILYLRENLCELQVEKLGSERGVYIRRFASFEK
jgi:hypothetical protein